MANSSGPLNSPKPTTAAVVGGVHNNSTPAPEDGQALPLQLDANGNLLVSVSGGGASSAVNITGINGVAPGITNPLPVELSDGTNPLGTVGNPVNITGSVTANTTNTDVAPASQNITAQDTNSTSTGVANGATFITGTPTAGSAASFVLGSGYESVNYLVAGTWTGTLVVEASVDGGTTWASAGVHQQGTTYIASSFTANFLGEHNSSGYTNVRVRSTASWTGTAVVKIVKTLNARLTYVANPVNLKDGTTQSVVNTIKPASTAAIATDTAIVVAISPNNSLTVTQPTAANLNATVTQGPAAANTAGWPTTAGGIAESTGAWTNATSGNTAITLNTAGYSTVVVTLSQTTTITGGVITFEASDTTAFTNAYPISAMCISKAAIVSNVTTVPVLTYTLQATTNISFAISVQGYAAVRARLSTVVSGTGTVNIGLAATSAPGTSYGAAMPVVLVGATASGNTSGGLFAIETGAAQQTIADNKGNVNVIGDNSGLINPLLIAQEMYGGAFSGAANATLSGWSKARTPTVFKTVSATTSGNTAIWTPGTGNKFRLLKLFIQVTDNASLASGAVLTVDIQDSSTTTNITFSVFVPTTAVTTVIGDGAEIQLDLGQFGILSAVANNVLNVNLSVALATGVCRIIAMGTEE